MAEELIFALNAKNKMKKRIKINGIITFLAITISVAFSYFFIKRTDSSYDEWIEVIGISFLLYGQLLRVSARGYKSENSGGGNKLILDGPYSMVRNPMYLGILCIALGVVLVIFHPWAMLIFLVFFVIRYIPLIKKEEAILTQVFGKEYVDYKKRVPALLPKFSFLIKTDIVKYLPVKFSWFKRELPSIVAVLFAVFAVELWEEFNIDKTSITSSEIISYVVIIPIYLLIIYLLSKRYEWFLQNKHE